MQCALMCRNAIVQIWPFLVVYCIWRHTHMYLRQYRGIYALNIVQSQNGAELCSYLAFVKIFQIFCRTEEDFLATWAIFRANQIVYRVRRKWRSQCVLRFKRKLQISILLVWTKLMTFQLLQIFQLLFS